ncbi:putative methyltransferase [Saccharolobus solfataricus rod-shaped virus 1]|uniref:Putative methyltransferase n=1 Tax=Saccharolobus solfataricus rod-shaped virus 1 TaxID=2730619 RepID=A0A6M3VYF5_SSRV1|nr:putative methyltransferase [Saccharolobus solfataricus rod-shaped virus 1]QJF12301.1 putative methyltransferase [Saccharolobus solfataricus rod-shaped virus 1]
MLDKYFHDLECDYWREYPNAYGLLNPYNKTIQIVGADCGSSALYFLLRGAKYVIQYEKEQHLREKWKEVCAKFSICNKAEMRSEWNGQYDNVDIFIIDCEGCEEILDVSQLRKYEQYCIAIHDWTKNRIDLLRKLQGLTFAYVTDDGREIVLCKTR